MTTTKEDDSEIPAPKCSTSACKKWAESVSLNIITARRCAILPVGGGKPLAAPENIPGSNNKIKEGKWEVVSSSVFFPLFNISGLFFFLRQETELRYTNTPYISYFYHSVVAHIWAGRSN